MTGRPVAPATAGNAGTGLPGWACCNRARPSARRRRRPFRQTCVSSTASAVEFDPAPAITGTRLPATSTQISTTRLCSSWVSVGVSPVVPTGTSPLVPCSICHSTKLAKAFSSTAHSRKGVMSAVIDPLNIERLPRILSRFTRGISIELSGNPVLFVTIRTEFGTIVLFAQGRQDGHVAQENTLARATEYSCRAFTVVGQRFAALRTAKRKNQQGPHNAERRQEIRYLTAAF